jgi:hypothetical protein
MPWDEAEELLAAYDASRAAAAPSAPANRAALRDLAADALADAEGWQWAPGYDKAQSPTYQHYLRQADAVLAVLPEPADRAAGPAALREAAAFYESVLQQSLDPDSDPRYCTAVRDVVMGLRHRADEAQQPETQARRDVGRETVEYFLQAQQDDGTWEDASSFMDALDWAAERLAVKRVKYPDFSWRMAERTTTVTVRPLPDCLTCRHWRCNGDGPCGALLDAWQRCACTGPAAVSQPGKEATS